MIWSKRKLKALLPLAHSVQGLSKDADTKIGALIIDEEYTVRAMGYNGLPRKVEENYSDRHMRDNDEKYYWYEHAERNALYNAIRTHTDIRNCYMLLTCDIPCCDCARGIIQSTIKGIILTRDVPPGSFSIKYISHSIRSRQMFREAGVELIYIDELET